jgi:hypothetical protein
LTDSRGAKGWGERGDMVESPREGGVLCLGVGCWGMKAGLPALLRIVIGPPLSVAGSSFLGLEVEVNERAKAKVPLGAGGIGVPFARRGPADFLSGFEKT